MKCSVTSCHACATFDAGCSECNVGDGVRHPCPKIVRSARTGVRAAEEFIREHFPELAGGVEGDAVDRILRHGEVAHLVLRPDDRLFVETTYDEMALSVFRSLRKFYSLNHQDAEDIVNLTFERISKKVAQGALAKDGLYRAYIYTVAANLAKDEISSARSRKTDLEGPEDLLVAAGVSPTPGPEDVAMSAAGIVDDEALEKAIASLSRHEKLIVRAFLELAEMEKKEPSVRAVARYLGLNEGGVSNFHRKFNPIIEKLKEHPAVKEKWPGRGTGEDQQ